MSISVKLTMSKASSKRVRSKLKELRKSVKNSRHANREVGIWLMRWVDVNFKGKGRFVGTWKPFAEQKYGQHKGERGRWVGKGSTRRFDKTAKLLLDKGKLRSSFDFRATRSNVVIGSELKYAYPHEEGLKKRGLPQRRMLPRHTDKSVERGILKIYDSYIERQLRK